MAGESALLCLCTHTVTWLSSFAVHSHVDDTPLSIKLIWFHSLRKWSLNCIAACCVSWKIDAINCNCKVVQVAVRNGPFWISLKFQSSNSSNLSSWMFAASVCRTLAGFLVNVCTKLKRYFGNVSRTVSKWLHFPAHSVIPRSLVVDVLNVCRFISIAATLSVIVAN